jgi:hypothetical protein
MKKLLVLSLILAVALALSACNRDQGPESTPGPNIPDATDNTTETGLVNEADPGTVVVEGNGNGVIEPPIDGNGGIIPPPDAPDETPPPDDGGDTTPPPAVVIPTRAADVVYSLSTDPEFQNLEVGTRGDSDTVLVTPQLMGAGNPTFRVVANPLGGVALQIDNREETWHAVDIVSSELGLDTSAYSYALTIRGNLSIRGNVTVGGGDSPYGTMFTQAADGDFTLTGTITANTIESAGSRGHLRVGANNLGNLVIHEIEIKRIDLVVPPPPAEVPTRPANVMYSLATDVGFQTVPVGSTGDGMEILGETPYIQNSGSPLFTVVANSGGSGNALQVHNRTADWHTIDLMIENMEMDIASNSYTIRVRGTVVDAPEGSTADVMGISGSWGRFGTTPVNADGSFLVECVVDAASMTANAGPNERHRVRFAISGEGGETVYTITELSVTKN